MNIAITRYRYTDKFTLARVKVTDTQPAISFTIIEPPIKEFAKTQLCAYPAGIYRFVMKLDERDWTTYPILSKTLDRARFAIKPIKEEFKVGDPLVYNNKQHTFDLPSGKMSNGSDVLLPDFELVDRFLYMLKAAKVRGEKLEVIIKNRIV